VFLVKKIVSYWLMPLPLCLALVAAGLLLLFLGRRPRLTRCLLAAAGLLLALLSNRFLSAGLLAPLEGRYPPIPEFAPGAPAPAPISGCRFVAVLGGGYSDIPGLPATSQLSASGLARIVEAVRILRVLPDARLIVSGPGAEGRPSLAAVFALAAASLGVSPSRITQVDTARDTEEESLAIARLAGGGRVALVTSAWHLPRAAGLFRKAGVEIVPCPADYVARAGHEMTWGDLGWDSESLERSTVAAHEYLGLLWLRLRGAI
jgi:uncharacterized SAM-binding protein YcdF (DUF218 family)